LTSVRQHGYVWFISIQVFHLFEHSSFQATN
jgi:hypothetical protein